MVHHVSVGDLKSVKVPSHLAVQKSVCKRHRKSKYDDQGGVDMKLSSGVAL